MNKFSSSSWEKNYFLKNSLLTNIEKKIYMTQLISQYTMQSSGPGFSKCKHSSIQNAIINFYFKIFGQLLSSKFYLFIHFIANSYEKKNISKKFLKFSSFFSAIFIKFIISCTMFTSNKRFPYNQILIFVIWRNVQYKVIN